MGASFLNKLFCVCSRESYEGKLIGGYVDTVDSGRNL